MPENTVYVGRPTKWGNRWTPSDYYSAGYSGSVTVAYQACVAMYRSLMTGERCTWRDRVVKVPERPPVPDVRELRGKNLACWCPLDRPCHADVLLELANQTT